MLNFIRSGKMVTFTGQAKNAGEGILLGAFVGVVANTVGSGDTGEAAVEGVYEVTKVSAQAWTKHAKIYWDDTAKNFTTTSSGNTYAGTADAAAANPSAVGRVNLHNGYP